MHNEQRGFVVADASAEQLQDLVRTRIAIESTALAQAFTNPAADREENLVLAFHRLSRAPRSLHEDRYEENPQRERLHRAFHFTLLQGCGSTLLLGSCEQRYDLAYRYRQLAARSAHKQRHEFNEHRAMFDAVMARRLEEAQRLIAAHYERTAKLFSARALRSCLFAMWADHEDLAARAVCSTPSGLGRQRCGAIWAVSLTSMPLRMQTRSAITMTMSICQKNTITPCTGLQHEESHCDPGNSQNDEGDEIDEGVSPSRLFK
ncbi:FCD domain-containing protein [Variovorax soli]|uniref:GntR C-terminal domain-containing protein n=1 Tax=Variovorax soli TaxID=376815 RepID=A0ABU1NMQ4_9BURK|nr:FCD domain-containing protein [Variovorax soli]MDR6539676.1 hypothetical protein [Variovorax soli]